MVNIQIEEKQKKYLDALARLLTNNESQKKDTKENYEELLKEVVKQICQVKLEGGSANPTPKSSRENLQRDFSKGATDANQATATNKPVFKGF
ncbi:879_t:CDS:2 [Entrophospora sp. SA101]|nr:2708_t:CDS:2 [Entrophospora sp. SA101]CAJ0842138.1 879_t:CDS:2 [Entrophospora sp. SA101]CAJ0873148.1 3409_t:CDS:2 [Entrophospora sp. SA101]